MSRACGRRRPVSARATAKSSSRWPPEYMMATTIPARFSPSISAPDIDMKATASTPSRPANKSRTMETNSPSTTGIVPADQHHFARSPRPEVQATSPTARPARAAKNNARRTVLSSTSEALSAGWAIFRDICLRSRRLICEYRKPRWEQPSIRQ